MREEEKTKKISCEEAQRWANLYFADLGGDVAAVPYLSHIEQCSECQLKHQQRMDDLWEYGQMMAIALNYGG